MRVVVRPCRVLVGMLAVLFSCSGMVLGVIVLAAIVMMRRLMMMMRGCVMMSGGVVVMLARRMLGRLRHEFGLLPFERTVTSK